MEKVNITDVQERIIAKLSKGYKQRVGIAQALLNDPPVLILDEPTIGLDPKQIHEVRELIKELAGKHTVVLSTHILPEVEQTCHRVIIIDHGKIVAVDTPQNLRTQVQGTSRIFVEVEGPAAEIVSTLKALPGVVGVRTESEDRRPHPLSGRKRRPPGHSQRAGANHCHKGLGTAGTAFLRHEPRRHFHQADDCRRNSRIGYRSVMRNIIAIVERELGTYFISPVAYVVLTIFCFCPGFFSRPFFPVFCATP